MLSSASYALSHRVASPDYDASEGGKAWNEACVQCGQWRIDSPHQPVEAGCMRPGEHHDFSPFEIDLARLEYVTRPSSQLALEGDGDGAFPMAAEYAAMAGALERKLAAIR